MSTRITPSDEFIVIDQASEYLASSGAVTLDTAAACAGRPEAVTAGIYRVAVPQLQAE